MSVLSFPRINFRGVFRTNPCTCNNDDVMAAIVDRDADTFGDTIAPGMNDAKIAAFLRELVVMSNDPTGSCTPFIRSGWNLYGDHTTAFEDAIVTSVVMGGGAADRSTSADQDPLVGQPVQLLGSASADPMRRGTPMLCDLDPTGLVTTQLWIGGLQLGSGADPSQTVVFDHDTRAFQNWLHFMATLGPYGGEQNFVGIGCLMQFAIPASAIPAAVALPSPGLQTLLTAARAAAGLVVRFRCFEVEPGITDENLAAAFKKGQPLENPAFGYLIGTIGPWEAGEPKTEPAGRKLTCPYPRPEMAYADPSGKKHALPSQQTPWTLKPPPALVGNAVAFQHDTPAIISLDLIDAFPKYGFRNPNGPQKPDAGGFGAPKQKANLGPVELAVIPSGGGAPQSIATLDYGLDDYKAYEDFGGIVDVAYDPILAPTIADGTLVIRGTADSQLNPGTPLVQETPIRVVTDDRALYLLPDTTNQIHIKVFDRGRPPLANVTIYLYEYYNVVLPQGPSSCANQTRPNQTVAQDPRGLLNVPPPVTFKAGSSQWLAIPLTTRASGATILAYQTDPTRFGEGNPDGVTGVPAWSFADYSSIRVFQDVQYPQFASEPIPWDVVYQDVLRFYYLVYPAMSRIIPLNAPDGLVRAASLIAQRLNTPDQPGFYTTYNMPVTRTMPPGKVRLVLDFLAQQAAGRGST